MISLKNKSILLFSPAFFGYEKAIKKRLLDLGAKVDFFDERPANTFWSKAFIRLYPQILHLYIARYYKSIYDLVRNNNYDYIFVINIEAMPKSFLNKMRENFPNAKFILYMWDSIHNKKNTINYLSCFDKVLSFDKNDCIENPFIIFRPLFFLNEYTNISKFQNYKYDLSFIGTAHSDRYMLLEKIRMLPNVTGRNCYFYLYLQDWKLFFLYKIKSPTFRKANFRDFNYVPLTKKELMSLIKDSRIIIDIQHPKQVGLTIRTIEMLGAHRKLITTNAAIKNYDFYNPNNILVIDRENPEIPDWFFYTDYEQVDQAIYYKYSLNGWLNDIFII